MSAKSKISSKMLDEIARDMKSAAKHMRAIAKSLDSVAKIVSNKKSKKNVAALDGITRKVSSNP